MKNNKPIYSYTIYRNDINYVMGKDVFDWRICFIKEFANFLYKRGLDIKIIKRKRFEVELDQQTKREVLIRDSAAIIQNDITGDYYMLDCHDWVKPDEIDLLVRDHRCKKILKCQYHRETFNEMIYEKVKPWIYFDRFWPTKEEHFIASRKTKPSSKYLYFRGISWGLREFVFNELIKREVMKSDYGKVEFQEYLRECSEHRIMLSLPGLGDICHRDIEGFANGTCILRPKLQIEFHNKLKPNYHYISVDIDIWKSKPVEVVNKIEQRFRDVIDDHDYLDWIAKNAMQWYDENVSLNNAVKLTGQLLGLC